MARRFSRPLAHLRISHCTVLKGLYALACQQVAQQAPEHLIVPYGKDSFLGQPSVLLGHLLNLKSYLHFTFVNVIRFLPLHFEYVF